MYACLFVTDKLGSCTVYTPHISTYDTHSESAWSRECFNSRTLTVCWQFPHWRNLRSEQSEVSWVHVHSSML